MNFSDESVPWTRITEHKFFTPNIHSSGTIITREYPQTCSGATIPYYPVNDTDNDIILQKYKGLAQNETSVTFGGRLADYSYYDMDDTILSVLNRWKTLNNK